MLRVHDGFRVVNVGGGEVYVGHGSVVRSVCCTSVVALVSRARLRARDQFVSVVFTCWIAMNS